MKDRSPIHEGDERIFTLSDVQFFFHRQKKKIFRAAAIGALFVFGVLLVSTESQYKITATFKEGAERNDANSSILMNVIGNFGVGHAESQAAIIINSYRVLQPLVRQFGMQASVSKKNCGFFRKVCRRICDNVLSEMGRPIHDLDEFGFSNVVYNGDQSLLYGLRFDDSDHFALLEGTKILAKGRLQEEVRLPGASLTIIKTPKNLQPHSIYLLRIQPVLPCVKAIHSRFRMSCCKENKSIYNLQFFHRDRHFGVNFLNQLMAEYRNFLKKDYEQTAKEQIAYLGERQEEIYEKLSGIFDEHANYLQQKLVDYGQIGWKEATREFSTSFREILKNLFDLDQELNWLNMMKIEQGMVLNVKSSPFFNTISELMHKIQDLGQQRDLLELSQQNEYSVDVERRYEAHREGLKKIREQQAVMQQLLGVAEREESFMADGIFDPDASLVQWVKRLDGMQDGERKELVEYLENTLRVLAVQEKVMRERICYDSEGLFEFNPLHLEAANGFLEKFYEQLTQSEMMLRNFDQLSREILNNDFEISSLSAVLKDPLSQQLIQAANVLALKLKDEKYRSEKEEARWTEDLMLQKKVLKEHLLQLSRVETINSEIFQEQISALKKKCLDIINGRISVLRDSMSDSIKKRKDGIAEEKRILCQRLEELRAGFKNLPDRWRKEEWLDIKKEMGIKMIQTLTELVETKTIGLHLHHVESKPLDPALLPMIPVKRNLFTMAVLGAFFSGFLGFFGLFFRAYFEGLPASKEKLQAMRYPVLSTITPFCDGPVLETVLGSDLEALRKVSIFFDESPGEKVLGLIMGKGPDYSYALAENFARMSRRCLMVRCDFRSNFRPEDLPGLIQVWKGELKELPIRKGKGYDILPSGGFTPFGAELVQSRLMQRFVDERKIDYDVIMLLFRSPLDCAESFGALQLCDKAIVTVADESTEKLTPFVDWAYHKGLHRLGFMMVDRV